LCAWIFCAEEEDVIRDHTQGVGVYISCNTQYILFAYFLAAGV